MKKILVIGASWVGDMVMAQSLFKILKKQNPQCVIDVLALDWSQALLKRMPEVNEIILQPLKHSRGLNFELGLKQRYQIAKNLRKKNYQQAILLPNSFKSALIPFWANIPIRTGYVGEFRYPLLNNTHKLNKTILTKTVQRFVALANSSEIINPSITTDKNNLDKALINLNLSQDKKILALCAGAEYGSAKRWSSEYFAEIAQRKIDKGWQVWLFGSHKDVEVANKIVSITKECKNLCGHTSLEDAIDLLSIANTIISNDSGLMHIAAALNKPLIAIYGSSDPNFTPPLNKNARILHKNLNCSPCFKRICPLKKDKYMQCMYNISVNDVEKFID
jgi:heptosyltransferase-2